MMVKLRNGCWRLSAADSLRFTSLRCTLQRTRDAKALQTGDVRAGTCVQLHVSKLCGWLVCVYEAGLGSVTGKRHTS